MLTEDDDGVGVVAAAARLVSKAVGLLVGLGTLLNLLEELDDLAGFGGTLGLDAVNISQHTLNHALRDPAKVVRQHPEALPQPNSWSERYGKKATYVTHIMNFPVGADIFVCTSCKC